MKRSELAGKKILIVGRGLEGTAAFEYITQRIPRVSVTIVDQKDGNDYLSHQNDFDIAIKSPGVPKTLLTIPYTTGTNMFFANTQGVIIGVTGTKGKSTTSSLIYAMLKAGELPVHLVGNIGNPMLHELMSETSSQEIYVCELSSYQLEDIGYAPHVSLFINFFPEHMNYHGGLDAYWKAKKRIVERSTHKDYFIYNEEYNELVALASQTKAIGIPIIPTLPFSPIHIPLIGKHNEDNIRAAITVARLYHIDDQICQRAVESFIPLPHRLENVGTYRGITFYDDAISTTPESTVCAIQSLSKTTTIFLGGLDRGYNFLPLVHAIKQSEIQYVVLFPDSGKRIEQTLMEHGLTSLNYYHTSSMSEAIKYAYTYTPRGTICLLSTASPSYSLWKNFEDKGDEFARYAKEFGIGHSI